MELIEAYFEQIGQAVVEVRGSIGRIKDVTGKHSQNGFNGLDKIWESNKAAEVFQKELISNESVFEEMKTISKYIKEVENAANYLRETERRNKMLII